MRSHLALALAFALAVSCVGDAFAFYDDNYRTTTVGTSGLSQQLIYRVADVADPDDGKLYLDGAGVISDFTAAAIRPAAAAINGNINVFYVDAAVGDLRRVVITSISTPPVYSDEVYLTAAVDADTLDTTPLALAVDEQGMELAASVVNTDPEVQRWSLGDKGPLATIAPVGPAVGTGQQVCFKSFNSIAYDFPSSFDLTMNPTDPASYRPSLMAFGADSCIDDIPGSCTCASDFYSTVGVVDLATVSASLEVSYPFASHGDDTVSYSYPAFNPLDNKEIAADETTATTSRVVTNTVGSGLSQVLSTPPVSLGLPSWSFDGSRDFVVTDDSGISSNLVAVTGTTPITLVTGADLPVQVLDGLRPFFASFDTSVSVLDFGLVNPGESKTLDVIFLNIGNLSFDISDIDVQPGSIFSFVWNGPLPITVLPNEGASLSFTMAPSSYGISASEDFIITTNWGDYPLHFTIDTGTDPGGDPDGDPNFIFGEKNNEGEFIGPCFINQLLR